MSIDTGASPYFMPCEQCNRWIEIFVRDEFNQPFAGVSGTLTDSAGNEFSVTLGEAPIYLEGLASGPVLLHLNEKPLTSHQFTSILHKALQFIQVDITTFKSHSFRIGGATYLHLLGVSEEDTKIKGRFKSSVVQSYIRV